MEQNVAHGNDSRRNRCQLEFDVTINKHSIETRQATDFYFLHDTFLT